MKNAFIVLLSTMCLSFATSAQESYDFAIGEWAPYTGEKIENFGMAAAVVDAVMKEMGAKANYKFFTWARAEEETKNNRLIATFPWTPNDKRKADFVFTDPFVPSREKFFYIKSKGEPKFESWDDVKKLKVGGTNAYSHVELLKSNGITPDLAPSDEFGFKKLHAGRVDLFPADELVGWDIIKKTFPNEVDKFGTLQKNVSEGKLAIMISKTHPKAQEFIQKFNAALAKVKANGTYNKILNKYNISE